MARNDELYGTWLELLGEILHQPFGASPRYEQELLDLLRRSFDGICATRTRVSPAWEDQNLGCSPREYLPDEPPGGYDLRQQPLLRWFALTGQTEPQSFGRVPMTLAGSSLRRSWEELASPWGLNQHLSIPLQIGGADHNAFLVYRPDRDFTEQELALARMLQPILTGLAVHFGIARSNSGAIRDGSAQDLTAREVTILTLLTAGLTAEGLARRLGISPRTVGKHLEHIYRKLEVSDRLMAVQAARELGLLTPAPNNFPVFHATDDMG